MKKWAFYFSLLLLAACAKDEAVIQTLPDNSGDQTTNLIVNVNYADCSTGTCIGVPVENADVQLFKDDSNLGNDNALSADKTNSSGSVTFRDLDQTTYVIVVDCDYGGTSQQVETPIGKTTSVLIEFQ